MQTPLDVPLVQFVAKFGGNDAGFTPVQGACAFCEDAGCETGSGGSPPASPARPHLSMSCAARWGQTGRQSAWPATAVLPTASNTVAELALLYARLVVEKDDDWIWEAMVRNPDLVGGFNRLDSTIIKAGAGRVIAKEGADGLLGLAIEHPDYPDGLGVVSRLRTAGTRLQPGTSPARCPCSESNWRNSSIAPTKGSSCLTPDALAPRLNETLTWDEWDPDDDRWFYDWDQYLAREAE